MQDELVRIKAKDYSYLDERLYNNIGVNSDLEGTINNLLELQCYLKSQIESLPEEEQKEATLKVSKVMMSSMVTEIKTNCNCGSMLKEVEAKIARIKRSCRSLKETMDREIKSYISDVKEIISENCSYLINISHRKTNENNNLKAQVYSLQEQLFEIKEENSELTAKLEEWESVQQKRREKFNEKSQQDIMSLCVQTEHQLSSRHPLISYSEANIETERHGSKIDKKATENKKYSYSIETYDYSSPKGDDEAPKIPMLLRRESCGQISRESLQKTANYNSTKETEKEIASYSEIKKEPYEGRVLWKQNTISLNILEKENELLKRKGMDMKNRKSTKKLKIFSMV